MRKQRGFQNSWWLVLITVLSMYIVSLPFMIFGIWSNFAYMLIGEFAIVIPVAIGIIMTRGNGTMQERLGINRFRISMLPYIILLPIMAQTFATLVLLPVQSWLISLFGEPDYSDIISNGGIRGFLENFIVLCIVAPVLEELVCRGLIMNMLKRYGTAVMLISSSLAFALMHQSVETLIPIFFLGMVLGLIRIVSGSVLASMIAHSASNLYSFSLMLVMGRADNVSVLVILACIVLFPIMLYSFLKRFNMIKVEKSQPTGFSVAMILTITLVIVINISIWIINTHSVDILNSAQEGWSFSAF